MAEPVKESASKPADNMEAALKVARGVIKDTGLSCSAGAIKSVNGKEDISPQSKEDMERAARQGGVETCTVKPKARGGRE